MPADLASRIEADVRSFVAQERELADFLSVVEKVTPLLYAREAVKGLDRLVDQVVSNVVADINRLRPLP